jgi:hypothetical protein
LPDCCFRRVFYGQYFLRIGFIRDIFVILQLNLQTVTIMEIEGKIIVALPEITGVAKATGNPWKKREYVLETQETYPKKVHFDFFGERADQYPLAVGDVVRLSFDIESREYMGRWYTSVRGWKAEKVTPGGVADAPVQPFAAGAAVPPPPAVAPADASDDLPF